MSVGIIAVPSPDYDPHRWWRYSEGVKDVVSEFLDTPTPDFSFIRVKSHEKKVPNRRPMERMKIPIVGLGYVGLPLAIQFARADVLSSASMWIKRKWT